MLELNGIKSYIKFRWKAYEHMTFMHYRRSKDYNGPLCFNLARHNQWISNYKFEPYQLKFGSVTMDYPDDMPVLEPIDIDLDQ